MKIYTCCYKFADKPYAVESKQGLSAFADGFWLDKDNKLAIENCTECRKWIPPSKIENVFVGDRD
jgi:hypothetical protein